MQRIARATLERTGTLLLLAAMIACVPATDAQFSIAAAQTAAVLSDDTASPSAFGAAADQVAAKLAELQVKHVAVFDFVDPKSPQWNRVGQQLAADFRLRLDAAPHKFKQIDRAEIQQWMQRDSVSQDDLGEDAVGLYITHDTKVDGWIFGDMRPAGSSLTISFNVYGGKDRHVFGPFSATIPLTSDLRALIEPPPAAQPDPLAAYPTGGTHGISLPQCVYCPAAKYANAAASARITGTVIMKLVVEATGAAGQIVVVRGLPLGLTDAAIGTVRNWQFKPAVDSNGNPVAVQQVVEVQFHLY